MTNIHDRWEEYRLTMPESSTPDQTREAFLAFFGGSASMYFLMMNKAMDEDVSQEEGEIFLDTLGKEIADFMKNLRNGSPEIPKGE